MKNSFKLLLITLLTIGLASAACEGPTGDDGAQGPQGEQGTEGPQGPAGEDGEDGNANVTIYEYGGHNFQDPGDGGDGGLASDCIPGVSEQETHGSAWFYYLVSGSGTIYSVPGEAEGGSEFRAGIEWDPSTCSDGPLWFIARTNSTGYSYTAIRIVQIEASVIASKGRLRASQESLIPADLDMTDYQAVMDYYDLTEEDAIGL